MADDFDEFMGGGGGKSFTFENEGDSILGTVVMPPEKLQQTDMNTQEPKFWQDGKPQWYFRVTLQTALRESDDDDGIRTLSLSWKRLEAVRNAVRASGAKGLKVGGRLWLRFDKYQPKHEARVKTNPAKLEWSAKYQPPTEEPDFMDEAPPASSWTKPTTGPAAEAAAATSMLDAMKRDRDSAEEKLAKREFNHTPTPAKDALKAEMAARGPQPAEPPF